MKARLDESFTVEVVNGGFTGDNIEEATKRSSDYFSVEPDAVTIYLGWNRTLQRADPKKNNYLYHKLSLYKIYYHFLVNRKGTGLQVDFPEKTYYSPDEKEIRRYKAWSFKHDIKDLDKLITGIQKKNKKIRVVLITIAGLFDLSIKPDEHALEIGHPTASSNNLFAFAVLTRNWNKALREYAVVKDIPIIDFEAAALHLFPKRSDYFTDSIHLTTEGYRIMGKYFTQELIKILGFEEIKNQAN
ncbi:SGNH/GDSL hydrolase family protein [Acidobacteriota bacterium]